MKAFKYPAKVRAFSRKSKKDYKPLYITIPKVFVKIMGLKEGSDVDVRVSCCGGDEDEGKK